MVCPSMINLSRSGNYPPFPMCACLTAVGAFAGRQSRYGCAISYSPCKDWFFIGFASTPMYYRLPSNRISSRYGLKGDGIHRFQIVKERCCYFLLCNYIGAIINNKLKAVKTLFPNERYSK